MLLGIKLSIANCYPSKVHIYIKLLPVYSTRVFNTQALALYLIPHREHALIHVYRLPWVQFVSDAVE